MLQKKSTQQEQKENKKLKKTEIGMIFVCVFSFRILATTKVKGHMAEGKKNTCRGYFI